MEDITIFYCDVNPLIKDSRVFQDLINDDIDIQNESITLQKQFYFVDLEELFKSSFYEILNKMRFWNINPLPYEVLNYFYENKEKIIDLDLDEDLVKYFEEISVIIKTEKEKLCNEAAKIGSLNLLKIACGVFRKLHQPAASPVASHLKQALLGAAEHGCQWSSDTLAHAASNGHLDCLVYLNNNSYIWAKEVPIAAARNGHLNCLRYIFDKRPSCTSDTFSCKNAAEGGHLDCLRYAHENGCRWDVNTCRIAAENGHIDCLKYAREHGCPWDEKICNAAAQNGHLDCLKYAHENGCHWSSETCNLAIRNDHLDCLKYARDNGCDWNKSKCFNLAKGECKQYILEN